jgi:hypothetical protein
MAVDNTTLLYAENMKDIKTAIKAIEDAGMHPDETLL